MDAIAETTQPIVYPPSDGKPMAESTKQWRWIVTIVGGLRALFASYEQIYARAEEERQRAEQERQRAERLAERLRALGVDPDEV